MTHRTAHARIAVVTLAVAAAGFVGIGTAAAATPATPAAPAKVCTGVRIDANHCVGGPVRVPTHKTDPHGVMVRGQQNNPKQ